MHVYTWPQSLFELRNRLLISFNCYNDDDDDDDDDVDDGDKLETRLTS